MISPQPLPSTSGSPSERRAVSFFRERTGPELSGLCDGDFWCKLVLQAAHADAGLRHAVVALAAVHEDFEGGDLNGRNATFALRQYNLAIGKHLEVLLASNGPTLDEYLAPCIVFICIELMQHHYGSAVSLVMRAVRMFDKASIKDQNRSAWPIKFFQSLLSRLQVQALGLAGPTAVGSIVAPQAAQPPSIPKVFSSVAEAAACFEAYTNIEQLYAAARSDRGNPPGRHASPLMQRSNEQRWVEYLEAWTAAFDGLLRNTDYTTLTPGEQNVADALQMRCLMLQVAIGVKVLKPQYLRSGTTMPDDQTLWDGYESNYAQIVELGERVVRRIAATSTETTGPSSTPTVKSLFTLELGLVGPLYDTARCCRHPIIRRRAIAVLRTNPCQEGLWDSRLAARVAERVMLLEEREMPPALFGSDVSMQASSAQISRASRISGAVPVFDLDRRRARIRYTHAEPDWDGTGVSADKVLEEIIEW